MYWWQYRLTTKEWYEMTTESKDRTDEDGNYVVVCDAKMGTRQDEETRARIRTIINAMMAQMRKYKVYGEASVKVVNSDGDWRYTTTRDTY